MLSIIFRIGIHMGFHFQHENTKIRHPNTYIWIICVESYPNQVQSQKKKMKKKKKKKVASH